MKKVLWALVGAAACTVGFMVAVATGVFIADMVGFFAATVVLLVAVLGIGVYITRQEDTEIDPYA